MKLNAAEMMPITWPEFGAASLCPEDQGRRLSRGLFADLTDKLCQITGYDAFSLQPNIAAQGNMRLTIAAYHNCGARIATTPDLARAPPTRPGDVRHEGGRRTGPNGDIDLEDFHHAPRKP